MKNLLKALAGFHATCGPVTKTSDNPFFKSKYASLEAIQEHIRKPLALNGLVVTQRNEVSEGQAIVVTSVWHVESGEVLSSEFPVIVGKHTAQEYGSAVTYAKRYSLTGLLNLTIQDEDDDGNKATSSVTSTKTQGIEGIELPWLNENSPEWSKVVDSLKNGYTIADVRKKFKVSKSIETKLTTK
jgi:hypothetical protein